MIRTSINEYDEQGKEQEANEETNEEGIQTRYTRDSIKRQPVF
jgi:hypothetical protein